MPARAHTKRQPHDQPRRPANARSILSDYREHGEALWTRFTGGREGTLWYYRALVEAFASHGRTRLVSELERVVTELERLSA